jgi:hypothetical protein
MPIGQQLDDAARERAEAVAAAIRNRGREVVKHEHTEQVIRQEISEDVQRLFVEGIAQMNAIALRLPTLEARISDLERALGDIARQALAKANEAA